MIEQSLSISEMLIWLLFKTWLVEVKVIQNLNLCVSFNKYNIPLFCWTGSKKNYSPWLRKYEMVSPHSQFMKKNDECFLCLYLYFSDFRKKFVYIYYQLYTCKEIHVYFLCSFRSSLMRFFFLGQSNSRAADFWIRMHVGTPCCSQVKVTCYGRRVGEGILYLCIYM